MILPNPQGTVGHGWNHLWSSQPGGGAGFVLASSGRERGCCNQPTMCRTAPKVIWPPHEKCALSLCFLLAHRVLRRERQRQQVARFADEETVAWRGKEI